MDMPVSISWPSRSAEKRMEILSLLGCHPLTTTQEVPMHILTTKKNIWRDTCKQESETLRIEKEAAGTAGEDAGGSQLLGHEAHTAAAWVAALSRNRGCPIDHKSGRQFGNGNDHFSGRFEG